MAAPERYNIKETEQKWQKTWDEKGTFEEFTDIMAALLSEVFERDFAIGIQRVVASRADITGIGHTIAVSVERISGYTPEEIYELKTFASLVLPEDAAEITRVRRAFPRVGARGSGREHRNRCCSGCSNPQPPGPRRPTGS